MGLTGRIAGNFPWGADVLTALEPVNEGPGDKPCYVCVLNRLWLMELGGVLKTPWGCGKTIEDTDVFLISYLKSLLNFAACYLY